MQEIEIRRSNGLAVASLVLGIVGTVLGLVPLTGFIAATCGALAAIFGFSGWRKTKAGAEHKGMAIAGLILGVLALALGIWGMVIVFTAASELERQLNELK